MNNHSIPQPFLHPSYPTTSTLLSLLSSSHPFSPTIFSPNHSYAPVTLVPNTTPSPNYLSTLLSSRLSFFSQFIYMYSPFLPPSYQSNSSIHSFPPVTLFFKLTTLSCIKSPIFLIFSLLTVYSMHFVVGNLLSFQKKNELSFHN